MLLLLDIGNTHLHVGLSDGRRILRRAELPTGTLATAEAGRRLRRSVGPAAVHGAMLCSVVPQVTRRLQAWLRRLWAVRALELTPGTLRGLGLDYPKPETIGPDRLANAVAVRRHYGAPAIAVDFGTAATFDVVNRRGNYVGGIIAPGLEVMTRYLPERTALLPSVTVREVKRVIGKSTEEAVLVGAVHGYRGLVRQLIGELKGELRCRRLPVVATGGCAELLAAGLPEIVAVEPDLTLEGLRLVWEAHQE